MTGVVQRVNHAAVSVSGQMVGQIGSGLLVLLGVFSDDTDFDTAILARKIANLRIFCDENDKMNRSVLDTGGEILVVSNFTLCADTKKGNRPSFSNALEPQAANEMYLRFIGELNKNGVTSVKSGVFGAEMQIDSSCNGPVTILLNTMIWR